MQSINQQPLISIITVCYNSDKTIRQTIESVLNQTYSNIEYILVDCNSTDNTINIIQEFEPLFIAKGFSYRYVSEPDKGIYDAMNKAVGLASGEWINIQGSDDWLENKACENVVMALNDEPNRDVIYGMTRYIRDGKVITVGQASHDFLEVSTINHQAIFLKRELHQKYGNYSLNYKICSDYEFLLRISGKAKFLRVEVVLANYSVAGLSSANWYRTEYENNSIRKKYGLISNKKFIFKQFFNFLKKLAYKFL